MSSAYLSKQWSDLGPAQISWKGNVLGKTAENPEGGTHGGVSVNLNTETRNVMRDAEGTNPHDVIVVGRTLQVKAALTGMSLKQLAFCIPGAELSTGPGEKSLKLNNPVGYSLRDNSGELIIKPIEGDVVSTDPLEWFVIPLAHPLPEFEFAFDLENQKVYNVVFNTFNSLASGAQGIVGTIGDDSSLTA